MECTPGAEVAAHGRCKAQAFTRMERMSAVALLALRDALAVRPLDTKRQRAMNERAHET